MTVSIADLTRFAREEGAPRASVFVELAEGPEHRHKSEILLRHARSRLEETLGEASVGKDEADAILGRFDAWARDAEGPELRGAAAMWLAPDGGEIRVVPRLRREGMWIGETFRVTPAWPEGADMPDIAVLVATDDRSALRMLSGRTFTEIEAEDLPSSIQDFLAFKELDPLLGGKNEGRGHIVSSLGKTPRQEEQDERVNYAKALGSAADTALAGTGTPLMIVADERLQGMIRQHAGYADLLEAGVDVHPDTMDDEALADAVTKAAQPELQRRRAADEDAVAASIGAQGSEDPRAVLDAAREGRVDLLLFDPDVEGEAFETVDSAVRAALATGARARAVSSPQKPLRARFRY